MAEAARTETYAGPAVELPRWLAERHRSMAVGELLDLQLAIVGPDPAPGVAALVEGAGFGEHGPVGDRHRLERLHTLPDWVGPGMRALVVGLNPSPASADHGVAFARPGNRFWPAALRAGLVSVDRDPHHALTRHGIGFTDLAKRTTRTAAELTTDDYRHGLDRLDALAAWLAPERLIVVGLTGWRAGRQPKATAGWQPTTVGGRPVYLMPNTSGLNAHTTPDGFVSHFATASGAIPG
ncbi:MAG: mismatch-specific DNA-glycosylase [Actinomycetota bacterium]